MDEEFQREEDLRDRQDGPTFRVGRVLRGTYDGRADEVLEPGITRLMLELAHVPYGDERVPPAPILPRAAAASTVPRPAPSLLRRLAARFHLA